MSDANRPTVLSADQVTKALDENGIDWTLGDGALVKEVRGRDFKAALDYVNRVGDMAEAANHHPDIAISWNKVTLELVTHSAGGITQADLDMAKRLDGLEPPAK